MVSNNILIIGSSGFIGAHLVRTLTSRGYVVNGVDVQMPSYSAKNFNFVQCDILNSSGLSRVLSDCQPQAVVHLAARTDLNLN